jgi:multidrug efflux pump subunit AcrA (membrane-fusion protein)
VSSPRLACAAAIADVEQKRALLEQAQLNLGYTKIVAPVSGEVNKTVVVGMNVSAGQQLLTVVPLDEVWVTANFKETQLRHMRVGQKRKSMWIRAAGRLKATWTALREQPVRCSVCFRRRMPPETT